MAACVRWHGWSEAPVANCFNSIEAPQPVQKTQPEPGRAAGDLPAAWLDCTLCPRHRANHLRPVTTGGRAVPCLGSRSRTHTGLHTQRGLVPFRPSLELRVGMCPPPWSQPWHSALVFGPTWDQRPAWASALSPSPGPSRHMPLPPGAGWEQQTLLSVGPVAKTPSPLARNGDG